MTLESTLDAVFTAFYAVIASGVIAYIIGWAISWTIRPRFAWWVFPLILLGLILASIMSIGVPLIALGVYQLGWWWVIRAAAVIVSLAVSLVSYWWGANSFSTRRVGNVA